MRKITKRQQAHRKYLQTEHWKQLRTSALERDGHKCFDCQSTNRLQVHHEIYRGRLEDGVLYDVVTLCQQCHRKEHGLRVKSDFEILYKNLERFMNAPKKLATDDELRRLCLLAADKEEDWYAEAMIRSVGQFRVIGTSTRMWELWNKKSDEVCQRFWTWAHKKRLKFQNRKEKDVREAL